MTTSTTPAPAASQLDETSSLLPLFIVLGVFCALAVGWFALSSCLGDDLRRSLSDRLAHTLDRLRGRQGRRNRTAGRYGRMQDDDLEATAFDVAFDDRDDELYQPSEMDQEDESRRYEARQSQAYYHQHQ